MAALRGARSLAYLLDMSRSLRAERLASTRSQRFFEVPFRDCAEGRPMSAKVCAE
jgi:hypothetical protein